MVATVARSRLCTDCFNCVVPTAAVWVPDRRCVEGDVKLRKNAHYVGPVRCKENLFENGPYHSVYALERSPKNEVMATGCGFYEGES